MAPRNATEEKTMTSDNGRDPFSLPHSNHHQRVQSEGKLDLSVVSSADVQPGLRSSPPSSVASSPSKLLLSASPLDEVRHLTAICKEEQLALLPEEFRSGDKARPLRHVDERGDEYHFALNPMYYSVLFILFVEMLERFAFYGINYTTTAYLTGEYNDTWNADMTSIAASSYVSISVAVAYTTPFFGAMLADAILGEYLAIVLGALLCYIPGLVLIFLSSIPQFLGHEFNRSAIRWGLLVLWPIGTGTVKACVNVFGAKQFHPILQSSAIETYYVKFYMCINIGALTGGIVVPLLAQWKVCVAYFVPVCALGFGVIAFTLGTSRYVRPRPKHDIRHCTLRRTQRTHVAPPVRIGASENKVNVGTILRVSALVVPFNVAYAQMSTTFIVQGTVMEKFGLIDASMMNNADAISVLFFGYVIGNIFYPALSKRGIKIPTTYKFAIGSALGAMAVACAIATEYMIHAQYRATGEAISVLWQAFPYFLIGVGEIFAVSAAYEVAFTVAPAEMKSLASAANLFMVGGAPNIFCIYLYNAFGEWFRNDKGTANIHKLSDYSTAKVINYFWLLEVVALCGVIINILPSVRDWVASIEAVAADDVKSPMATPNIRKKMMQKNRKLENARGDEESPLVNNGEKQADYPQYENGPQLIKYGSMRAGPTLKSTKKHDVSHPPPHSTTKKIPKS